MSATDALDADAFHVYDTTLRDGSQQEGISLAVNDKLTIAHHLDALGVGFIEGGWPGAVPKDTEFFRRARTELDLKHAQLAAFGATRRAGGNAADDPLVAALRESGAPVVTLVAKSHVRHVELALRTTLQENLEMIRDTVSHLTAEGRRVFLDAEHFFDGYLADPAYALECVRTAAEAGASVVVLCDTNGGMLPKQLAEVVHDVVEASGARIGIHTHDDAACAVANALAAVDAGATHVQGTANGYGERSGNANLFSVVANLQLKLGHRIVPESGLSELTHIAHAVSEVTNLTPNPQQPYVGVSAFAHKAGLHASAVRIDPDLYQHIDPKRVGNDIRMLVSEMAGRASIEMKGRELGFDLSQDPDKVAAITNRVKELEAAGSSFEAADASFELVLREEVDGKPVRFFETVNWRAFTEQVEDGSDVSQALVKVRIKGEELLGAGEGHGAVNALDNALRAVLSKAYPDLARLELTDYKVRILDGDHGTSSRTRVLITSSDGEGEWTTVGVADNLIAASWKALVDAVTYGLLRRGHRPE